MGDRGTDPELDAANVVYQARAALLDGRCREFVDLCTRVDHQDGSWGPAGPLVLRLLQACLDEWKSQYRVALTVAIAEQLGAQVADWRPSMKYHPVAMTATLLYPYTPEVRAEMPANLFCYFALIAVAYLTREIPDVQFQALVAVES